MSRTPNLATVALTVIRFGALDMAVNSMTDFGEPTPDENPMVKIV